MLIAKPRKGKPTLSHFKPFKGKDYVVVELRYDSGVSVSAAGFKAPSAKERVASSLNSILARFRVTSCASHFGLRDTTLRARSVDAPSTMPRKVPPVFAQSGVLQVVPRRGRDCDELARRLNRHGSVWKAYKAPQPVPAAVSPNMEPCQGYLCSSPDGIGAMAAWEYWGGMGEGVAVCDIEGDWNFSHEDLPAVTHLGGDLLGGDWKDHGTAVLGEIVAKRNGYGAVGIAPKARPKVHSAVINGLWNTALAITNAAGKMGAGDVILIELQGSHPATGEYVAMQYWDDVYSAIKAATEKGITVVEAAGNGDQDFQAAVYNGSNLQKDSGAIVVGAGVPPNNFYDHTQGSSTRYTKMGVPRSRAWFSNYGKIVNVQGWGEHVTTLGYGDAQTGAQNRWYTHRFSGTSSASPIVTGAVACLQGIAMYGDQAPLEPSEVRKILVSSGTPQADDPARPKTEHIGPLPNLEKAITKI
ncbi:MAG: S8 family serine peptidase [Acidobacteriota bacterium]|nr:S8 family serine peptidase [Acidobacteriota bacterium]